jgi:C-terminal processing protease CtpA/Prc
MLAHRLSCEAWILSSFKDRVEMFEEIWRTINDNYADPTFGGVDWGAVRERYRPRIEMVGVVSASFFTKKVKDVYRRPIAVLVDEGSGSAAESFAPVIQDSKRGIVIGRQTAGAGLEQGDKKLKAGWTLWYGRRAYLSPQGRKVDRVGVIPDKIVPLTLSDLNLQRDAVLEEAVKTLEALRMPQGGKS